MTYDRWGTVVYVLLITYALDALNLRYFLYINKAMSIEMIAMKMISMILMIGELDYEDFYDFIG